VLGLSVEGWVLGVWILGFGVWVLGLEIRDWGLGFEADLIWETMIIKVLRFKVQGLRFGVWS